MFNNYRPPFSPPNPYGNHNMNKSWQQNYNNCNKNFNKFTLNTTTGNFNTNSNCNYKNPNKSHLGDHCHNKYEDADCFNNLLNDKKKEHIQNNETPLFEILGFKIYFDDLLILCLLFFLYQEGIKDQYLFISLILLLIS